jgi:hypothetical protein
MTLTVGLFMVNLSSDTGSNPRAAPGPPTFRNGFPATRTSSSMLGSTLAGLVPIPGESVSIISKARDEGPA